MKVSGTIIITVRGVEMARRTYRDASERYHKLQAMLERVISAHRIVTIIPDVTEEVERTHCAPFRGQFLPLAS